MFDLDLQVSPFSKILTNLHPPGSRRHRDWQEGGGGEGCGGLGLLSTEGLQTSRRAPGQKLHNSVSAATAANLRRRQPRGPTHVVRVKSERAVWPPGVVVPQPTLMPSPNVGLRSCPCLKEGRVSSPTKPDEKPLPADHTQGRSCKDKGKAQQAARDL